MVGMVGGSNARQTCTPASWSVVATRAIERPSGDHAGRPYRAPGELNVTTSAPYSFIVDSRPSDPTTASRSARVAGAGAAPAAPPPPTGSDAFGCGATTAPR